MGCSGNSVDLLQEGRQVLNIFTAASSQLDSESKLTTILDKSSSPDVILVHFANRIGGNGFWDHGAVDIFSHDHEIG
jgi:hypothetical protein